MHFKHLVFSIILVCFGFCASTTAVAQKVDALSISYDLMYIKRIHFKDGSSANVPGLYRNFFTIDAQRGPLTLGMMLQVTSGEGFNARADQGLMLTGSFEHYISYTMRARILGRVGVLNGIDYGNILYPQDTDLHLHLGYFNPDGVGFFRDYPLFPSGYFGLIVNRFGRVQATGGVGTFWNNYNIYLTGFYAFNGVSNIGDPPPEHIDIAFSFLNNSGVNLSIGRYLGDWYLGVRRNFPVFNSGNEWVFSLQHTFYYN